MNHANNNAHGRPENLPIANLDDLQPVNVPYNNKIFPVEISSGSSDKPPHEHIPADSDVEKAVVTEEEEEKEKCFQSIIKNIKHFINRPAFKPWLLTSICLGIFSWKVLTEMVPHMEPLFGIDRERQAQALDAIFSQAKELGKQQEQCIHEGAAKCRQDYDTAHDEERAQIDVIRASNQAKLQQASTLSSQCIMRLYDTEAALRDLVLSGGTPPFIDNTNTCPAEDKEELLAIAGGKVRRDQNEIMTFLRVLSDEGETQTEYLKDLAIYNRDYFLGQIGLLEADLLLEIGSLTVNLTIPLPPGIDGLITCVTPDTGGLAIVPCPIEPLTLSLKRVRETARIIISISKEQLDLAAMAIATLVDRYDWAVGSIKDLVRIFNGIRNVLGRPFDLAFNSLSGGFDLGQFDNLPYGGFYVSGDLDFPTLPDVPPIDPILADFRDEIEKVKEATREIAAQATEEIREKVDALVAKVRQAFDRILEDYDPPNAPGFSSLDIDKITDKFASTRQQAFDQIVATVNRFGIGTETLPESEAFVPPGASIAFNATSAQVQDAKAALLPFSYPDIPGWVWRLYTFLLTKFWVCDIIAVAYHVLRRGRKVYDESSTPIPVVHMQTTAEKDAEEESTTKWKMAVLLTHDLLPKIFTCLFGILFAFFSVFVYYSVYLDYRRGCVESTSGTYIGRVLVSNYVSTPIVVEINEAQESEAVRVEKHYQNMCHDARITTALNQTQQSQHLASIMNEYNTSIIETQRLLGCIDLDAFDGVDPDLFTCIVPLDTVLEEGVASCDWGECVIDCDQGAVTAEIQRIVIENTCIIEEQYHARFWLFCVILWAWFSLKLFSNSIHDCAPYLFPKIYGSKTIKVELERYLESGELLGSEGKEAEEAMDKAIASLLLWNKLKNWCYVLVVLACNGAWITILVLLGNGRLKI
jgi:hypothetical protein